MSLDQSAVVPLTGGGSYYDYTIDQSVRFYGNKLTRNPGSGANLKKWTFSFWWKKGKNGRQVIYQAGTNSSNSEYGYMQISTTDSSGPTFSIAGGEYGNTNGENYISSSISPRYIRDYSGWYHFVIALDNTLSTGSDRLKIWINGVRQTVSGTPSQNRNLYFNAATSNTIGRFDGGGLGLPWDAAAVTEMYWIDGQQLDADSFGEFGDYGDWRPIEYTGTYGTKGWYLPMSGSTVASIGTDSSGNGNNWSTSGFAVHDILLDSPTNNFATLNPLTKASEISLSEGNLRADSSASSYEAGVQSTFAPNTGKWYGEAYVLSRNGIYPCLSFATSGDDGQQTNAYNGGIIWWQGSNFSEAWYNDPNITVVSSISAPTLSVGDKLMWAIDADNGKLYFGRNGTWLNSGNPASGTGYIGTIQNDANITIQYVVRSDGELKANFGQDSSFSGSTAAQGNTDDNGYGDFYYTPPSGFLALCTANLSDPAVIPSENYQNLLWTGNGTDDRSITGVGFQPDFLWNKSRSAAYNHEMWDVLRGTGKRLSADNNYAEQTRTDNLQAFQTDGFEVGTGVGINNSGTTYVGWNWKAGGSGSSNTNGDITSTVSANQDAGFSIVSYTGYGEAVKTVGHGLSQAPEYIMFKSRGADGYWHIYNKYLGNDKVLYLNTSDPVSTDGNFLNNTTPSSSLITLGTSSGANPENVTMIAYCFHSVDGFSKVGTYTGNGSSDGTFVYTGFRPAVVILKPTSNAQWVIMDSARNPYNVVNKRIFPETNDSESTYNYLDFTSNGFKLRYSGAFNSGTISYIAFAETPFKYTNAR